MPAEFFVIEDDPIVRMDIEEMLAGHFVGARVNVIERAVARDGYVFSAQSTVIVRGRLVAENPMLLEVVKAAKMHEAHVVVMGDVPALELSAVVIDFPFTTQMLQDAINVRSAPASEI